MHTDFVLRNLRKSLLDLIIIDVLVLFYRQESADSLGKPSILRKILLS